MKLTLQIKLLPSEEQAKSLLATMKEANAVCNRISETVWEKKVWNQFKVHNAARNIAFLGGAVNHPEKPMLSVPAH